MYYLPIFIGSIFLLFYGVIQILEAIKNAQTGGVAPPETAATPKGAV
jgi:hypothetical protein